MRVRNMLLRSRNVWGTKAELYFDNVEVISNRTDRLVVEASLGMNEDIYFNTDFNKFKMALLHKKYLLTLYKYDYDTSEADVMVLDVKFIASRTRLLEGDIEVKIRITFEYK